MRIVLVVSLLVGCTSEFPPPPILEGVPDGDVADVPIADAAPDAQAPVDARLTDVAPGCEPTPEGCDGIDQDCDGRIDEGVVRPCWTLEPALRNVGRCMDGQSRCIDGEWNACADGLGPADEVCNGVDDDCDGVADEITRPCYDGPEGTLGVGLCAAGEQPCAGGVWSRDCANARHPADELCDGLDDDCDGPVDEGLEECADFDQDDDGVVDGADNCRFDANPDQDDLDGDGLGDVCDDDRDGDDWLDAEDCEPTNPERFPGAPERCDGVDDDCDASVDEALSRSCYDGPEGTAGVGLCRAGVEVCFAGGWEPCEGALGPAEEKCDGRDEDCDGLVDEGLSPGWPDADGDGFGDADAVPSCPLRFEQVGNGADCDDGDPDVRPGVNDRLDPDGRDLNCDGVDGERPRLIFAAPDGDDATADGSPERPFATVPAAITAATELGDPQGVIVGVGQFAGPVNLAAGVGLYGGYDRADGWARGAGISRIHAEGAAPHLMAVRAFDLGAATDLDQLALSTGDNPTPGGSVYGLYARNSDGLRLRAVEITTGAAGPGRDGADGVIGGTGSPGAGGGDCGDAPGAGGASACAAGGDGGQGGRRRQPGAPGRPDACGGRGGDPGGGAEGEDGRDGCSPLAPPAGADGPAAAAGAVVEGLWSPGGGSDGLPGRNGLPGGGGGGGGGAAVIGNTAGSGGGGGGAGCAGSPGRGGRAGGGAFALFLVSSDVRITSGRFESGPGGPGGAGGLGGPGGAGGPGGGGGDGRDWFSCGGLAGPGAGGDGGRGADGSRGGHGAGADGGPSIAIVCVESAPALQGERVAGPGGDPGGGPGNQGALGISVDTQGCVALQPRP